MLVGGLDKMAFAKSAGSVVSLQRAETVWMLDAKLPVRGGGEVVEWKKWEGFFRVDDGREGRTGGEKWAAEARGGGEGTGKWGWPPATCSNEGCGNGGANFALSQSGLAFSRPPRSPGTSAPRPTKSLGIHRTSG